MYEPLSERNLVPSPVDIIFPSILSIASVTFASPTEVENSRFSSNPIESLNLINAADSTSSLSLIAFTSLPNADIIVSEDDKSSASFVS